MLIRRKPVSDRLAVIVLDGKPYLACLSMFNEKRVKPWTLIAIGGTAGIVGGGLGVGGGLIMVPLLMVIGFDRHRAHATSLAGIALIALAGATSFGISGEIELGLGVTVGVGGVVGSVLGASAMHRMTSGTLSLLFGVILLVAAVRMIFGASPIVRSGDVGDLIGVAIALGIGLAAGFIAGVAGVGGGVVIVPATVFFLGLTQHEAQGTSLAAIVLTAIAGTVVNMRNERVRLVDGLVLGAGGVIGSIVGSRVALGTEGSTLSLLFGFLVLLVAIQTLYRALRSQPQSLSVD